MLKLGARRFRIQVCEVITDPETGQPAPDSGGWFHMINHGLADDEEERLVTALTPWFHAFLVQNAEIVGQIIEGGLRGDD